MLYEADHQRFFCEKSGGALQAVYDYRTLAETSSAEKAFSDTHFKGIKRFIDLLPLNNLNNMPRVPVGDTPCCPFPLSKSENKNIYFKLEHYNPSGSYYDRAFSVAAAVGKENGFSKIGGAVFEAEELRSLIFASRAAELESYIFTDQELAENFSFLNELSNTHIIAVKTNSRQDLFECAAELIEKNNCYNCSLHYNPYSRDGLKTIALELFRQHQSLPDYIFLPPGRGTLVSAVYRGFEELDTLGWVDNIPRIISGEPAPEAFIAACQHKSNEGGGNFKPGMDSKTVDNIFAPRAVEESGGEALALSEQELNKAQQLLTNKTGLYCSQREAAGLAAFKQMEDTIEPDKKILILLGGSRQIPRLFKEQKNPPAIDIFHNHENINSILENSD
jgi:threonine synthase